MHRRPADAFGFPSRSAAELARNHAKPTSCNESIINQHLANYTSESRSQHIRARDIDSPRNVVMRPGASLPAAVQLSGMGLSPYESGSSSISFGFVTIIYSKVKMSRSVYSRSIRFIQFNLYAIKFNLYILLQFNMYTFYCK